MVIARSFILKQFKEYIRRFDGEDPRVALKSLHSGKVASNAETIAKGLGLSDADTDLAWALGMLHDIGRFEQIARYHTFSDGKSMNHAAFGAKYLFQEGHIRDFIKDAAEDTLMEKAIALHSVYELPSGLTKRELLFCRLLRDADKTDIFRVYAAYSGHPEIIWNVAREKFEKSKLTDEVYEMALTKKSIPTSIKKEPLDFYVGGLAMYFDVNFEVTRELIWKQGYLAEFMNFHSSDEETEKRLSEVKKLIV
ncbi:HD domain-containing protein [Dialister sp.]|uniref:HD domain-containing protein n=1 Tax=Dialister sp. TaxID=1955814 RepID=UPI002E814943|nr:HD domain-containing protein [Dialister sp.]MEE3452770.1 HD domain-containing protein [Dialister sp.]